MPYYKDSKNKVHFLHSADSFHLLPSGSEEITEAQAADLLEPVPEPLTVEQIIADYVAAIQVRMDKFAQTREYDNIASLVSYAGDPDPVLDAEGSYGKQVRSATWVTSRTIYAEVKAGTRQAPTLDELFAELPVLTWPV